MQINNNVQSPNFGMALKITPSKGAQDFLKKQSADTLEHLGKIGEEFKNYKFWDLLVTDNGFVMAEKKPLGHLYGTVVQPKKATELDRLLLIDTEVAAYANKGETRTLLFNCPTEGSNSAKQLFDSINSAKEVDKFAHVVRLLESKAAIQAAEEAAQRANTTKIENLTNDLISKYSDEFV